MPKRRLVLTLLSIPLLFLLLFGGIALFYLFANPTTARVSIQPESKHIHNAATVTVVTAHPDLTQQQIAGARLLSFTNTHTLTQTATGKGYAQATSASGTMEMTAYVPTYGTATISAGTRLTGYDGITIVADQTVTAYDDNSGRQTVYFHAHVVTPGAQGNIPAYAFHYIDHPGQNWHAEFYNVTPFTGGQNAGPYTFVQQNDISIGEQTLAPAAELSTFATLLTKRSANEQWVSTPTCVPNMTTNHNPNDRVQQFQVTVTATCSGEVYNTLIVKNAASQKLAMLASNTLGKGYHLAGNISTTITTAQVVKSQQGMLSISVLSQGIWVFQFTQIQKQRLIQLVRGKSTSDAQKLLLRQEHIAHVTIVIMYGFWLWNTLPTDEGKITLVIQPNTRLTT
jgi:hypothetical protein